MNRDASARQQEAEADQEALLQRRRNARRTALFLGALALAIFVTFLATGVIGRV